MTRTMRLTKTEARALRAFRDGRSKATRRVHGHTRHALERKGLLRAGNGRGWTVTPAGRAVLCPPDVPNIFDDLFDARKKESVMPKKTTSAKKKKASEALAIVTDVEIDAHPLLDREQQKLCKSLRTIAKRNGDPFTMLQFAEIALRASGNNYAAVTDQGGHEAARRDSEHCQAAILYVYEAIKAGPAIVSETAEHRGTLKDLELLAIHL